MLNISSGFFKRVTTQFSSLQPKPSDSRKKAVSLLSDVGEEPLGKFQKNKGALLRTC